MADNCILKRPAAIFLTAGLILGLVILPCGCRPSPALAQSACAVIPLEPVSEEETETPRQILYAEPDLPADDEPDTKENETKPSEDAEDTANAGESINSSEEREEATESTWEIPEEQEKQPAEEQTETEEGSLPNEPETVPGAEVTEEAEDAFADEPAPAPSSTAVSSASVSAGDSGVDPYYVQLAAEAYLQAPQWVRTLFENAGWHICVRSGGYFGAAYGYSASLLGLTVYDEGNIYISAQEAACNRHIICHELGHFIDWWYGFPSSTAEFSGIYNAEYVQFCNFFGYANGYPDARELFAESLYHDWTDPGNLQQAAPGTYAYIQNAVG